MPAQANIASMVGNMANTFFWKHSDEVERQCKLASTAIRTVVMAVVNAGIGYLPFLGEKMLLGEAAVEAVTAAKSAEKAASEAAQAAEKAMLQEASVLESTVAANEAESVASSNLRTFESENPSLSSGSMLGEDNPPSSPGMVHGGDGAGFSSEREASRAAEQSTLEAQVAETETQATDLHEEQQRLAKVAKEAQIEAIWERTKATAAMAELEKKGAGKYLEKPARGTFSRMIWDGKKVVRSHVRGYWSGLPFAFSNVPFAVSYHLNTLVTNVFLDLVVVHCPNVGGTDCRKRH